MAPVPTAMFTETGELRIGKNKSVLKNHLKVEVSERRIESQNTCSVIDGSAVLYVIHWPLDGKIHDYIDNFKSLYT